MREEKTKERETIAERIKTEPQPPAETETESPNYEIYNNIIYGLVDSFIDAEYAGRTEEEIKTDKAFFNRLTDYIYNNYIGELLGNKYNKSQTYRDIKTVKLIDNLFDVYLDLVFRYKWNNKPFLVEFSLFTGINKKTFYEWINKADNYTSGCDGEIDITLLKSDVAQKWVDACERGLLNGSDTIRDIFILKAKHNYKEAGNGELTINVNHKAIVNADILPDLIGINSKD